MTIDWDEELEGTSVFEEKVLPPLTGVGGKGAEVLGLAARDEAAVGMGEVEFLGGAGGWAMGGIVVGVLGVGGLLILRSGRSG